jgi:hypothetical protein
MSCGPAFAEYSPDRISMKNTFVDVCEVPALPDLARCQTEPVRKSTSWTSACSPLDTLLEEDCSDGTCKESLVSTPKLPGLVSRSISRLEEGADATPVASPRVLDEEDRFAATPEHSPRFMATPDATPMGVFARPDHSAACAQYLANLTAQDRFAAQPVPAGPAQQPVVMVPVLTAAATFPVTVYPSAAQNASPQLVYQMQPAEPPSAALNPTPPYRPAPAPAVREFDEQRQRYLAQWQAEEQKEKWAEWEMDGEFGRRRPRRRRQRRVEPIAPESGCKVFVGGLGPQTTSLTLRAYFSQYGRVLDAAVLADAETKRSRGFGFVDFAGEIPAVVLETDHVIEQRRCGVRKYEYAPA